MIPPSVEGVINNDGVGGYEISSPTYSECRQFDAEDASSSPLFPRYMSSMPGQQPASTPPPDELSDGGTEPGVWPQDEEDCGAGNGEMGGAACPEVLLSSPPKRRRPKKAVAFVDSDIDGSLVVWIGSRSKVLHHVECHQVPSPAEPKHLITMREALEGSHRRLPSSAGGCCRYRFVDSIMI